MIQENKPQPPNSRFQKISAPDIVLGQQSKLVQLINSSQVGNETPINGELEKIMVQKSISRFLTKKYPRKIVKMAENEVSEGKNSTDSTKGINGTYPTTQNRIRDDKKKEKLTIMQGLLAPLPYLQQGTLKSA